MTKIFIAGSRQLSRLPAAVKQRLDAIMEKDLTVLIGDANGSDRAVQRHFADRHYQNVIVHCMARNCRNNVGHWPTHEVAAPKGAKGFAYYAAKDQVMVDEASHGLMLWDGDSKGTLNSIVKLARLRRPTVVYFAPTRTFHTVRSMDDMSNLLGHCDPVSVQRLERELGLEALLVGAPTR